jgi:predicted AAA+ superfamily ATPase
MPSGRSSRSSKELDRILEATLRRLERLLPPLSPPTDWKASIAFRWRNGTGHGSGGG